MIIVLWFYRRMSFFYLNERKYTLKYLEIKEHYASTLLLKVVEKNIKFTDTQVCIYDRENESENDKASGKMLTFGEAG